MGKRRMVMSTKKTVVRDTGSVTQEGGTEWAIAMGVALASLGYCTQLAFDQWLEDPAMIERLTHRGTLWVFTGTIISGFGVFLMWSSDTYILRKNLLGPMAIITMMSSPFIISTMLIRAQLLEYLWGPAVPTKVTFVGCSVLLSSALAFFFWKSNKGFRAKILKMGFNVLGLSLLLTFSMALMIYLEWKSPV